MEGGLREWKEGCDDKWSGEGKDGDGTKRMGNGAAENIIIIIITN